MSSRDERVSRPEGSSYVTIDAAVWVAGQWAYCHLMQDGVGVIVSIDSRPDSFQAFAEAKKQRQLASYSRYQTESGHEESFAR